MGVTTRRRHNHVVRLVRPFVVLGFEIVSRQQVVEGLDDLVRIRLEPYVVSKLSGFTGKSDAYIPRLSNRPALALAFLATDSAIATACFCGLPAFISRLTLLLTDFWL